MSSTNKTTNYKLSQYIGTDKPTYLGDYNGDMNKIDAAIKAVKDAGSTATSTAASAESKAEAAQRTAGEASASADAAQRTADNAKTLAQSAQTTATGAAGNASSALTKAQAAEQNVADITNKNIWTAASGIGNKGVTNYVNGDFHANYNKFSKLLNVYGQMEVSASTTVPSAPSAGQSPMTSPLPSTTAAPSWNCCTLTISLKECLTCWRARNSTVNLTVWRLFCKQMVVTAASL